MKKFLFSAFILLSSAGFGQTANTEIVSFSKGEIIGSCQIVFTRESGEELSFWNPDLGAFADPNNPCQVSGQFQDYPLLITWQMGSVQFTNQAGGTEVMEDEILLGIELAQ